LGTDAEKMKRQEKDEMEYDDDTETEEGMGSESEESDEDPAESGDDSQEADKEHTISKSETTSVDDLPYSVKKGKKSKDDRGTAKLEEKNQNEGRLDDQKQGQIKKRRKKLKHTIHVESSDLDFEIHYAFHDEPHILLAQVTSELNFNFLFRISYFETQHVFLIGLTTYNLTASISLSKAKILALAWVSGGPVGAWG
jgi:DNA-directed RNA polymerase I subunit RPA1